MLQIFEEQMMSPPHSWSFTRLAATRAFITRRFFWAAFSLLSTGTSTPQNPLLFLPVESAVEQTHTSVFLQSSQVGADRTLDGTQMGGGAVKIMPLWGCSTVEVSPRSACGPVAAGSAARLITFWALMIHGSSHDDSLREKYGFGHRGVKGQGH